MSKVLIVLTSHAMLGSTGTPTGYYLSEVSHPYHELNKVGISVDIASIKGGKAPVDPKSLDLDDPINKEFWENPKTKNKIENTLKISEVKSSDYQGILFSGGHGTMWDFRGNEDVQKLIKELYENDGAVAAVCHGPAALVDVKLSNGEPLVKGKKVAGFTNAEEKKVELETVVPFMLESMLRENGAEFVEGGLFEENVQVDQRLVTGQNPASAKKVGSELAKIIKASKKD